MHRLALGFGLVAAAMADCNVATKTDCGYFGIMQQECESKGCCWQPVDPNPNNDPWCFVASGGPGPGPAPSGCKVDLSGSGSNFPSDFVTTIKRRFESQLNVQGSGAVEASPDANTPGGSYVYHWMRDGALSMWSFLEANNNSYTYCQDKMTSYLNWVGKVQNENDPNGNSVLIEPKFNIPSGSPYTGGWCRPQTDGPGLRANTLVQWSMILVQNGQEDQVRNNVWPKIQKDLSWVVSNWQSNGCDLWEEVRSNDFFWNRMAFVYSLKHASTLATRLGDSSSASTYSSTASNIYNSLSGHWNGNYLIESSNRQMDGSVLHAIASFGDQDSTYGPLSPHAASTLTAYGNSFCAMYPINVADNGAGIPGVLIGRYPGDSYAGGNPWQLLTAGMAQVYYKTAVQMQQIQRQRGGNFAFTENEHREWKEHLNLAATATSDEFVSAATNAGDSIMQRLYHHIQNDGGRVDEQIEKHSGSQTSAQSLTWSYANILVTLNVRSKIQP